MLKGKGNTNDRVIARVQITSGNIDPVLQIDGQLCQSSTIFNLLELNCTLTSNGTHTIEVSGSAGQVGGYNLHLQRSNNPANQTAIAYGQTRTSNIAIAPEMDVFAFTGNAGDQVIVRMQITSGSLDPNLRIYSPNGNQLCTDGAIFNLLELNCILVSDGLHMIFAYGADGQTGGYILHVRHSGDPLISQGANDGWILESLETSNKGGTRINTSTATYVGDNAQKKQYRSILSFSTKFLPDNAIITKVILKAKKQGVVGGGNPVNIFQGFIVDVKKGFFGSASGLQVSDFQAKADKSYGPLKPALKNGWYTLNLTKAKAYINLLDTNGGVTQVRLRFKLDDNNNTVANALKLYSGNAPAASRPQLIIEYYVP